MVRRWILIAIAGLLVLGAAVQSPAATAVAPYIARGRVAMSPGTPERPAGFVMSATLTQPARGAAIGPAPRGGTLSLTGTVRSSLFPPNPCLGSIAAGGLNISWNDGTKSKGTFTAVMSKPDPCCVLWLGNITSGRFRDGIVSGVGLTTHPPNPCSAPFTGGLLLTDPS
jgi:hypothetical protein